ncbi:MAG: hypothetical protein IPG45_32970 [Deltaproteobacteria bacterium]|jgi:uncharacterized membrane protein|nr:hypothetical protein [Deltaproteobacteria bacterium]
MKRHPNEQIIYGLFEGPHDLKVAFDQLVAAGIPVEDMSVMMNEETHDEDFKFIEKTRTRDGATAGGIIGGALGGMLGGLAALGAASGIGLLVVGPAIAFAAAGGLLGGLVGNGVPDAEAKRLHEALHEGQVMLAVHTHKPEQIAIAERVFADSKGEKLEESEDLGAT